VSGAAYPMLNTSKIVATETFMLQLFQTGNNCQGLGQDSCAKKHKKHSQIYEMAASLSKNARTSSTLSSFGVSAALNGPDVPLTLNLQHSVSTPSFASTSTYKEVERLSRDPNTICNPNSIIDKHPPYKHSKRGGLTRHEAEVRVGVVGNVGS
jgi:hypothetical protein